MLTTLAGWDYVSAAQMVVTDAVTPERLEQFLRGVLAPVPTPVKCTVAHLTRDQSVGVYRHLPEGSQLSLDSVDPSPRNVPLSC